MNYTSILLALALLPLSSFAQEAPVAPEASAADLAENNKMASELMEQMIALYKEFNTLLEGIDNQARADEAAPMVNEIAAKGTALSTKLGRIQLSDETVLAKLSVIMELASKNREIIEKLAEADFYGSKSLAEAFGR